MTGVSPSPPYPVPSETRPSPPTHSRALSPRVFRGVLWWGVLVLVRVGSGWCWVVCPVSRPGSRAPLRQPLRGGLRIALRKGLRRALCPVVRPALRRRVMGGLGLPKFLGLLLGLLGKVGIGMPPRRGQQSWGEAW